jgi:phage-related protein (TIGR01555 family)
MLRQLRRLWRIANAPDTDAAPVAARPFTISEAMLSKAGVRTPNTVVRRELQRPDLPPGVIPPQGSAEYMAHAEGEMAMDDAATMAPVWGWANAMSGFGCGLYFPGYPYLSELAQRSEYRIPSQTIASEMTRKWIKFKGTGEGDKSKKIEQIEARFKELQIQEAFRKAELLDGQFGRGQIYINIKGQDDKRAQPLVIDQATIAKGSLIGFKVIEPIWTTPVMWNAIDPTRDDFYKPTMWYVLGRQTHASRLIMFLSREVPDLLKPSYNFGGISLTQLMETYVNQWLRTRDSVSDLINNFSKMILFTDMGSALTGGTGENVINRMQLAAQFGDNRGFFVADKATEDLKNVSAPLSGLHELQAQSQEHMCAPSQIPLVKLTGITPSGLSASSEGEIQVWYDHIVSRQVAQYSPALDQVLAIVQLDLFGEVDDQIGYEYVPLTEPDGEALARQRKTDAEAGVGYIDAGVIDPQEERERLMSDPLSGYNNLTGDAPEPPQQEEPLLAEGEGDAREAA